jgi:hypothetical protein
VKPTGGDWEPLVQARFTGDSNPATNVDAGPAGSGFFLATGGAIENRTTKLREVITRAAAGAQPPAPR